MKIKLTKPVNYQTVPAKSINIDNFEIYSIVDDSLSKEITACIGINDGAQTLNISLWSGEAEYNLVGDWTEKDANDRLLLILNK